jgi:cyclic-di-GMP phosphodiesterase TipF (flagellum assembly factor)
LARKSRICDGRQDHHPDTAPMPKPAALFVAVAMTVTAACVGVIAAFGLDLGIGASLLAAFGALAAMAVVHLAFIRSPGADLGRLDDLDRVVTQLQSRLETMEARLSTLDGAASERARAATRPLVEEIAALGGLVTSVAKEVASHDAQITRLAGLVNLDAPVPAAPPPPAPAAAARPAARAAPRPPADEPPRADPHPFDPDEPDDPAPLAAGNADRGLAARLELALRDDRLEIHLQPIVALPSRRRIHYEALSRIAEPDGLMSPDAFLSAAAAAGRTAEIDRRAIETAADVARRLVARGRAAAVFVNVAAETLADARGFRDLVALFERTPDLGRLVVLELSQAAFAGFGPVERDAVAALVERGARLSMDRTSDLRLEPRELSRLGVRFVKVAADRLLDPDAARGSAIHPADLSSLLARQGVDLIATHVEEERTVPELLDMDVKAAQGFLFGLPRPVRPSRPDAPEPPQQPTQLRPMPTVVSG